MAMYLSQKWGKKFLEWLGGVAVSPPLSLTCRMWTVAPDETGTGGTEVVGGAYTEKTVVLGTPANGTGVLTAQALNSASMTFSDMPVASTAIAAYTLHDDVGDLVLCNDSPDFSATPWAIGGSPQVAVGALLLGTTKS